ncbi:MAG TPA: fumarylacetoacetate hydrolase [Pelagibacterium sp.]|jgi:fumarylacetoacetate (FAA) hydrolase family protein|uniref:fumarylacetoacetate hydrolase family protein n=1 Tax=uncultured Pelagibacterium sp. TaxID=1159875 RepID=UPI000C60AAEA|nr:fumarylacetoacetate hydrolase [Pelagibacterium sp.]HCO54180.1 fumarylacetoacetate hydrolase [Pelagibacterium sp.]|tara:strand:- start:6180 stop:7313 length:1134 start_codon:yes stop_codon:yes gene_type:complete
MAMSVFDEGIFLGRVRLDGGGHPRIVTVRDGKVVDITAKAAPTVRDICEMDDPAGYVRSAQGNVVADLDAVLEGRADGVTLLSPVDLQAIKASGVTFVVSLLERVIEEQAKGDAGRADQLRGEMLALIGEDLSQLVPGSDAAMAVKAKLIEKGVWSQYLEVGIGPDAEIFTKCQPMASVGHGASVGLHPISTWNNPEPEVALIVSSTGEILGATLGNDVNLRDVEGRSALLLGKAKDNNASAALGPFIRLFDGDFSLDDVKQMEIALEVVGEDGFRLSGHSSMSQISRTPESLVAAALGTHHQYPDGLALYLGTMFAPVQDRDGEGKGFTHKRGDVVTISTPALGALVNTVGLCTECAPWTYGPRALMGDLARAGLL